MSIYSVSQVIVLLGCLSSWSMLGCASHTNNHSGAHARVPLYLTGLQSSSAGTTSSSKQVHAKASIVSKSNTKGPGFETLNHALQTSLRSPMDIVQERSKHFNTNGLKGADLNPQHHKLTEEELSVDHRQLRANNFVHMDFHASYYCADDAVSGYGFLLNNCFQYEGGGSYFLKTNTHSDTLIQLTYSNSHCTGVPDHVTDLFKASEVTGYNDCANGIRYSYLSDYPTTYYAPSLAVTFSSAEHCDADDYYYAYEILLSDVCYTGFMISTADCQSTHEFQITTYEDIACETVSEAETSPEFSCLPYADDDYYYADDEEPQSSKKTQKKTQSAAKKSEQSSKDMFDFKNAYMAFVCVEGS